MKNNEVLQSILYCNQLKRIHHTQPVVLQTQVQPKASQGCSQCFKSRVQPTLYVNGTVKGTVKGTANVTVRGYSQSTAISMAQLIVQPMYSQFTVKWVN